MKIVLYVICAIALFITYGFTSSNVNAFKIQSYGHYKKMIHMKKTKGGVTLQKAIPADNAYAVGAIQKGLGEITIINSKIWLDYGNDGLGNSSNSIPANEKAILLATSQVKAWEITKLHNALSKEQLFQTIIEKAKQHGIDTNVPFPFLLEGNFDKLILHVINGQNSEFKGHGGKEKLFKQAKEERDNQEATVIGFYSADNQDVYTHPGESWHLHAVIRNENIGAHVDGISTSKNVNLKLPLIKK